MNPIVKYFNEEKVESYLLVLLGVIALAITLYLRFVLRSPFWIGVASPLAIVALLEIAGGIGILYRSPKDIARVAHFIKNESEKIISLEIPRMRIVMRNFLIYRTVGVAMVLLGVSLMFGVSNDNVWSGVGVGLFIQATIILCVVYLAEKRGNSYFQYLINFAETL